MPLKERLYSKIKVNEYTGCWEWQGTLRNGYGRMIIGSRTDGTRRSESAHRVSYMLNYGGIPDGMDVCHKCDNPCCINPEHLAEQHADAFLEDCKRLEAELEQVKRERDAIEQDFCVFTKQWLEEGSGFLCRWCKYENTGRCEWKESHPTCQDVCFGKFFEWRGPQRED